MLQQVAFSWTDGNVEILKSMLAVGATSGQIAKKLRCSRNAVIGKAHRMDLSLANSKSADRGRSAPVATRTVFFDQPGDRKKPIRNTWTSWTEERLQRASKLWKEGKSKDLIAIDVGCTVSALVSKTTDRRDLFPKRGYHGRPRRTQAVTVTVPGTAEQVDPIVGVFFDKLESHHCKWPVSGDVGPKMVCCGSRRIVGSSYCLDHANRSRGVGTHSERKALFGRAWQ